MLLLLLSIFFQDDLLHWAANGKDQFMDYSITEFWWNGTPGIDQTDRITPQYSFLPTPMEWLMPTLYDPHLESMIPTEDQETVFLTRPSFPFDIENYTLIPPSPPPPPPPPPPNSWHMQYPGLTPPPNFPSDYTYPVMYPYSQSRYMSSPTGRTPKGPSFSLPEVDRPEWTFPTPSTPTEYPLEYVPDYPSSTDPWLELSTTAYPSPPYAKKWQQEISSYAAADSRTPTNVVPSLSQIFNYDYPIEGVSDAIRRIPKITQGSGSRQLKTRSIPREEITVIEKQEARDSEFENEASSYDLDIKKTTPRKNESQALRVLEMASAILKEEWQLDQTVTTTPTTVKEFPKRGTAAHSYFEMIEILHEGYMMVFLIELTRLIATKERKAVRNVVKHTDRIVYGFYRSGQLLWSGPLLEVTMKVARLLKESKIDDIQTYTNSISRIRPEGDHRVVNLPQETVSEYSDEEYSGETNKLDNVHNFITRGTTVQDKNKNMKLVFKAPRVETLTEFIQEAVKILNTYEDTAFEDFFHVLDKEIRRYHYRGCKFSELTQNSNTRSLLSGSLKLIRGKPVPFTKAIINGVADIMRNETYNKNVKEMLDYINSLYTNTDLNLHSVLNELKYYGNTKSVRTHNNLVQVIKGGVRAVLFNPYTELNINTRRELKERIEIFWKQFKNNPASSAEKIDIPNTDRVIKSVINNISTAPENIMNDVINPKHLKNKRESIVSMDTYGEQFQHDETEKDESNNESGEQITNYNTDKILSDQSFDSSSNSIKNSQERHEKYNTQRYMTLYTEEISYKSKTTKKTEIIPISASVMTRKPKVKKRPTTMSTTRERDVSSDRTEKLEVLRANHETDDAELNIFNSSHDTENDLTLELKHESRARENYDKQQKHGKADKSRSKSKQKNVEIISQYDAVIDVQLANTELLKSLGMFEPLGVDTKYETTLYPKSDRQTKPLFTKSTKRPRAMQAQAKIKPQKPTAPTKPSRYSKRNKPFHRNQLSDLRKNFAPPFSNEGHQFMKDINENQNYLRRSDNDTIRAEDFNTYVIKRINTLENKLNEIKQMNDFSFRSKINDDYTNEAVARNVTEKFEVTYKVGSKIKDMKGNVIERLLNEGHDLNNEEVNDGQKFSTRNNTMNTESSTNNNKSRKPNVIKKDAVNVTVTQLTVIDNENTTQVTTNISKVNVNVTKKLNKEVINNNVTTSTISLVKVSNKTKLESVVTTPTVGITRRTMAYSEPSYDYDSQEGNRPTVHDSQIESFLDHVNDGIDLRM